MNVITGYAEGYYGRLLGWTDRARLVAVLGAGGLTSYLYAPKDDPCHRQHWRVPYDDGWLTKFAGFVAAAKAQNVSVIAGIAPGLDFDFAGLESPADAGSDFVCLLEKAQSLAAAGASRICLLMDDIDADFMSRCGKFTREGQAHAALTNALGMALGVPLIMVPRIYADSLISDDDLHSLTYLDDLVAEIDPAHQLVYCGDEIVSFRAGGDAAGRIDSKNLIVWDNFYANDYCPRRLFLGPWRHRGTAQNWLLNPTGMIETDLLLLDLFVKSAGQRDAAALRDIWRAVTSFHGVPACFHDIAGYFDAPFGFAPAFDLPDDTVALDALDQLLWRWKSPLQREWYPALMGLKQDLAIADGSLPSLRINKTQLLPLAGRLISADRD